MSTKLHEGIIKRLTDECRWAMEKFVAEAIVLSVERGYNLDEDADYQRAVTWLEKNPPSPDAGRKE